MEMTFNTLAEVGEYAKVTRQAVFLAVKEGKLKAVKVGGCWRIHLRDLDHYRRRKYMREYTCKTEQGDLMFSTSSGRFSAQMTAKYLSSQLDVPFPVQKVYHQARTGRIPFYKDGHCVVFKKEDLDAYIAKNRKENASTTQLAN